jgi:hypothetical protein
MGWRQTCLVRAALNFVLGLPLNRFLLPLPRRPAHWPHAAVVSVGWKPRREMFLVAFVFAGAWFVTGSMATHLPRLLETAGATPFAAITAAAFVGPAQVVARTLEFLVLRQVHPLVSAGIAATLHPIGAAALAVTGASGAAAFAVLYGAGNGLLTIARGTVPLAIFGPYAYGERTGLLGAPAPRRPSLRAFRIWHLARRNRRRGNCDFRWSLPRCLHGFALPACLTIIRAGRHGRRSR